MKTGLAFLFVSILGTALFAQEVDEAIGRWDVKVQGADATYPSWIEIRKSGYKTLVGTFVGRFGSARPIAEIRKTKDQYEFTIPPQWESRKSDLSFQFHLMDGELVGSKSDDDGNSVTRTAKPAPTLARESGIAEPEWGEPVEIFNGKNLDGWKVQMDNVPNGWIVKDGLLFNEKPGNNLVTEKMFDDFKLHAEFRYPEKSNSGLYLRGRYEVQIEDSFGQVAECHKIGGVYGFLTPSVNAAKPAGEWQEYDITLVGRHVTVILNGERVIDRQEIPGITGGALDSDEGKPGPILIQGDHGPIEFRKLIITPATS